ncbi:Uncharacterised protein [Mycobacteroides abscessus subsp. bolletii]|uniref:hypothetical protein n=1 Tax=Mycobacteroides abscessus TaxID=36809 RepID=UPI00092C1E73|nr:hypothetical protein [Mycobacteroides abscessus]SIN48398.1 Uncharacterised protein [Mycobacteroides abscessus subsp. bolletii]
MSEQQQPARPEPKAVDEITALVDWQLAHGNRGSSQPATPAITVIWSADELRNLPTETLLTWTDFGERIAAVLFVDQDEVWVSHTGPDHWSTSIDHVRYPAQAFIWPAAPDNPA